jgi:hypothetical protein
MSQKTILRVTVDMDNELKAIIKQMADERNVAFSYMSYVLLQSAVREKQRKRSKADPQHNSPNAHPHNAG